jgi:hypothetical protein
MQLATDVQTFNEVYGPTCNPYNPELSAEAALEVVMNSCHLMIFVKLQEFSTL